MMGVRAYFRQPHIKIVIGTGLVDGADRRPFVSFGDTMIPVLGHGHCLSHIVSHSYRPSYRYLISAPDRLKKSIIIRPLTSCHDAEPSSYLHPLSPSSGSWQNPWARWAAPV